jgi:NADH pyrophosphatase NudC (nudix superfamily)
MPAKEDRTERQLEQPRARMTAAVAELADEREVSERTVWRWIAQMRARGDQHLPTKQRFCEYCGEPLSEHATQRRRYCDGRCRVYAARKRDGASSQRVPPSRRTRLG